MAKHEGREWRRVVSVRSRAGVGASGRNGGWCHPDLPVSLETLAEESDRDRARATQSAMFEAVDEVGRVAAAEGIEQAHFYKGGLLAVATGPEQIDRVRENAEYLRSWGFGDSVNWLEPEQVDRRLRISGCCGATYTSRSAVVQSAALARGLADTVERLGVPIYERSLVTGFGPGLVQTARGSARAQRIVRATEGYSVAFSGYTRRCIPIYSLMIATAPLPDAFWDEVGWGGRETLTDGRHLYIYAARTPDGRIAIGGRGAPYHYQSRISRGFEEVPEVFDKLRRVLQCFFPAVGDVEVTHRWGGALAQCSRRVVLGGLAPADDCVLEAGAAHFSNSGAPPKTLDMETGERRSSTMKDLLDATAVLDAIESTDIVWPIVAATDQPDDRRMMAELAAVLAHTRKHVQHEVEGRWQVEAVRRMSEATGVLGAAGLMSLPQIIFMDRVGHNGNYLLEKETRRRLRAGELFMPLIADRQSYEHWRASASDELETATGRVRQIVADAAAAEPLLDDHQRRELDESVAASAAAAPH